MRFFLSLALALALAPSARAADAPNVLLVVTDDQGFGDLGAHGNPVVKTPHLDAFTKQSAWLKNFHVCPVCSPTRSALLTGKYNYRTGIVDTFIGRSLMRPDVRTLAELLKSAGYRTGLFGKWHLGDNYPLRPEDRGFDETLWSAGGGLAQPSDPPGQAAATAYFDPILMRNGKEEKTKGYCTDVFTDGALKFIGAESKKPFFAYVAYNAPHGPYQVPAELAAKYAKQDLSEKAFPQLGQPWATKKLNTDAIAKAYGMIENIDTNFQRMLKALEEKKLTDNTIIIFLTDNGPGDVRWNAGLRNRKGTVYDGGTRVPCYVRWPAKVKAGTVIEQPLAHIDIAPTLLNACGTPDPKNLGFDGRDIARLLADPKAEWADRTLFVQWHRGDEPEKLRSFAARGPRYKLVQAAGTQPGAKWTPKFELFDIPADPFEEKDLAAEKPDEVAKLKTEYEAWFADVTKKGFAPPRIPIGHEKAPFTRLTRQDWRGPNAAWGPDNAGHWEVTVARAGKYRVTLHAPGDISEHTFTAGGETRAGKLAGKGSVSFDAVLKAGDDRVSATVSHDGKSRAAPYIEFEYLGPAK
jgi:arylsulfatase A-like enzyme